MTKYNRNKVYTTRHGGAILLDRALASFMDADSTSDQRHPNPPADRKYNALQMRAALVCLSEAQLLEREITSSIKPPQPPLPNTKRAEAVSAILVSHNSRGWLEKCLRSLQSQSTPPREIILVDNASEDDTCEWVKSQHAEVHLISLPEAVSLARAINIGVDHAQGDYVLLLNPDVVLNEYAVAHLLAAARSDEQCAAVAAKLKFLWAPAFINGVGNFVGRASWGTDIGLGHLDLGQFDKWEEVPSACFAAALIPIKAWKRIGNLDEGFPMYYEDTEWCYRARLLGYSVRVAPKAEVLHAFSGRLPSGDDETLPAAKLENVVYGRLRFIHKLMSAPFRWRYLTSYVLEDILRFGFYLLRGKWSRIRAILKAWEKYLHTRTEIRSLHRDLESRKTVKGVAVFQAQRDLPPPFMWRGMPVLTWDLVCNHYLPLIIGGKTRPLPELNDLEEKDILDYKKDPIILRAWNILKHEGLLRLLYTIIKQIQWHWMRL